MITSFPNNKNNASSDQAIKHSNNPASTQGASKVVRFTNIQNLNHEKAQYDQAKQAINQAASALNW